MCVCVCVCVCSNVHFIVYILYIYIVYIYIYIYIQNPLTFFICSTKIKQNNSNVFSLVDQNMLVNTMVPIFHAQNLLHILKKKKKRLELN